MKIKNIDLENKVFVTEDEETFPIMFDIDESITIEMFQEIINNTKDVIEKLL